MPKRNRILISIFSVVLSLTLLFGIVSFFAFKDNKEKESFAGSTVEEKNTNAVISLTDGASFTLSGGAIVSDSGDSSEQENTHGGAVYVGNGSTFNMRGGIISNFTASNGGAIYIAGGGTCIITGGAIQNSFDEETKSASFGGAIYVASGGKLQITDMSFKNCLASGQNGGNAIYAEDGASVQFGDIVNGSFSTDKSYSRKNAFSSGKGLLIEDCGETEGKQFYFEDAETNLKKGNLVNIPVLTNFTVINESINLNNVHISDTSAFLSLENCCGYFKDENLTKPSDVSEIKNNVKDNIFTVSGGYTAKVTDEMKKYLTFTQISYNEYTVRCSTSAVGEIVIPEKYNGIDVRQIYFKANVSLGPSREFYNDYYDNIETGFMNCSKITAVYMPSTITNIPNYAFSNCRRLEYINIHDNVVSISDESSSKTQYGFAFRWCESLKSFYVNNIEKITWGAFVSSGVTEFVYNSKEKAPKNAKDKDGLYYSNVLVMENGDTYGKELIAGSSITESIPDDVETISPHAFTYVMLEGEADLDCSKVDYILTNAFLNCPSLKNITVSETLKFLGSSALTNTSITKFTMPESLKDGTVGSHIFRRCYNLQTVDWNGISKPILAGTFGECYSLTEVKGTQNVTSIGERAFQFCSKLKNIDISNVQKFGNSSFEQCFGLETVHIDSLIRMDDYAFGDCVNLKEIKIDWMYQPSQEDVMVGTVFGIKHSAFSNCYMLNKVEVFGGMSAIGEAFSKNKTLRKSPINFYLNDYYYGVFDSGDTVYYGSYSNGCAEYNNEAGVHTFYGFSYDEYQESFAINKNNISKYAVKVNPSNTNECELIYYTGEKLFVYEDGSNNDGTNEIINKTITKVGIKNCGVKEVEVYCDLYSNMFENCKDLEKVTATKLTEVKDYLFNECQLLESVSLPRVTSIGQYAFSGCSSLNGINAYSGIFELPNVKSVGDSAFNGCSQLKTLKLAGLKSVSAGVFTGLSVCLESLYINGATTIPDKAFENFTALSQIDASSVTSIGQYAFNGCSELTQVFMKKVTSIGDYAFKGCSLLARVNATESELDEGYFNLSNITSLGDKAFMGCSSLKRLNLNALEEVSNAMFYGLSSYLTTIEIQGVKTIPDSMFENYTELKKVNVSNVEAVGNFAFDGCSSLIMIFWMNNVKTIGLSAFNGCSSLESISLPVAESIGNSAFQNCSSLEEINSDTITTIGDYAFQNCTSLEEVVLDNVKTIGTLAFACDYDAMLAGNASLTTIYIPNVETIEYGAFRYQNNLKLVFKYYEDGSLDWIKTLSLPNLTSVGAYAFAYTGFNAVSFKNVKTIEEYTFYNCSSLGGIYFANVEEINNSAFACDNPENSFLGHIYLPKVEKIGDYAFKNQKDLLVTYLSANNTTTTLTLNNLKEIGKEAFFGCSSLLKIKLEKLEKLGSKAFAYCTSLDSVSIPTTAEIASDAFIGCSSL